MKVDAVPTSAASPGMLTVLKSPDSQTGHGISTAGEQRGVPMVSFPLSTGIGRMLSSCSSGRSPDKSAHEDGVARLPVLCETCIARSKAETNHIHLWLRPKLLEGHLG